MVRDQVAPHLDCGGRGGQAVENAIGQRGIADLFVPLRDDSCEVRIVEDTFTVEHCSGSPQKAARNHPGIAFTFPRNPQFA
jgi:hypothetical protein